jgi:hypothetical protein
MLSCYRVTFDDALVYQFECSSTRESAAAPCSLIVFRVRQGQCESRPFQRADGRPMQFEAATRRLALALACEVLQAIHGRHVQSIVTCDTAQTAPPGADD